SALYAQEFKYKKVIKENGLEFDDYHRSLTYYSQLFEQHGLQMCELSESNSLGTSQYPDFIIFVLRKKC
ncbi:MAG: hypothetical protein KBB55_00150, partial [Candidatus Buchananbacteria bacterium]|nr:hypothetical protein [Candidatus Buchananbacteria bacterium]